MLYETNMKTRPVQVSIDEDLLKKIDRDPETRRSGRSAVVRSALRLYLEAKRRRGVDAAIRRAYSGEANEMLGEIEELMGAQEWPKR